MSEMLFTDLLQQNGIDSFVRDVSLKHHSTWKIGGAVDIFVEPKSREELVKVVQLVQETELPLVIIGNGSNLLFADRGVRGVVIKVGEHLAQFAIEDNLITADAGVFMPDLAIAAGRANLTGLEHTIGIPGHLGGLIFMNGGSLRQGIGDLVEQVTALNMQGEVIEFTRDTCEFSYRSSVFQRLGLIVLAARLRCALGEWPEIRHNMLQILRERRRKLPLKQPNCGSVFASDPVRYADLGPAGKIIEDAGLKGKQIGGAMISHKHANFIVNVGNATASDVMQLVKLVRRQVYEQTKHWLPCEARYVAEDGTVRPLHECL